MLLNGKQLSKTILQELKDEVEQVQLRHRRPPGLGIILVGSLPASCIYVNMKKRACKRVGINNFDTRLNESASQAEIIAAVHSMNANPSIDGILVQLPLPTHIDEAAVLSEVAADKDVDGFHARNMGNLALKRLDRCLWPCTPTGCMELLRRNNVQIAGKHAVVVGRSNIVGVPLSLLLLHADATVTVCHSKTVDLPSILRRADIIVAAVGKPECIKADYIKDGAVVVDVGINRVECSTSSRGYRLVGDVEFDGARAKASWITPVPGGVGPMTIAMLLKNTVKAYCNCMQNVPFS